MGLRTWIFEKIGIKLKRFPESINHEQDKISADRNITLPKNGFVRKTLILTNNISFGDYTYAHSGLIMSNVVIGRYCSIAGNVTIAPFQHHLDRISTYPIQGWPLHPQPLQTNIGHDVWIGEGTIVMSGITVGTGSVIGAGAVVTKDVPPYAIVGGIPAKIIRYRFDESTIQELLKLKWWELEMDDLTKINLSVDTKEAIEQLKRFKHSNE